MNRRQTLAGFMAAPILLLGRSRTAEAAPIPQVKSGQGQVLFYRPRRPKGAAIRFVISRNGHPIGNLSNGGILAQPSQPGNYSFSVSGPSLDGQDAITVSVGAGQTVFVKGEIRWGWPAGRPKFVLVSEAQGRADVQSM